MSTEPDVDASTPVTNAPTGDPTLVELRACIETACTGNPLEAVLAVRRARALLAWLEAHAVDRARAEGWSWGRIAQYLGIARQSLHRRHGARDPVPPQPPEREAVTFEERARANEARFLEVYALAKAEAAARAIQANRPGPAADE